MLTKNVEKSLNDQIMKEGYSSNLYLAMASWAETEGFEGISGWLYAQSEEERVHELKLIHFVNERGGRAVVPSFQQPPDKYDGVREMFLEILKHEQFVTASINNIVAVCISEKDFSTQQWLQWFVNEQLEEEKNVRTILDKLKILGEGNLYLFDRDILSMRTKAVPDANSDGT